MNAISKDVFTFQFENLQLATGRNETLLCQIRSVNGGEAALQVFKNEDSGHAEEICLQANEHEIQGVDQSEITWFLSWSSCERCAPQIIEFVEQHPNVKLNIFVSRLFHHQSSPHKQGLRALSEHERIGLKVMTLTDFQHCFDHFVGEGNGIQSWADLAGNSARYAAILKEITKQIFHRNPVLMLQDTTVFCQLFFSPVLFIKMKKLSSCDFTKQFKNLRYATGLKETWLCQILKEHDGAENLKVHRNRKRHAEMICLRQNESAIQAEITWYVSWSPCDTCAPEIITFMEKHPNVKLNIFASRLYYGNNKIISRTVLIALLMAVDLDPTELEANSKLYAEML
ncbi:DNA dC-_dU-editing enzyme APOBEC-3F-like, partial [Huso huso]